MIWPEGTNPGHVDRKQRHTRVALNAHTGCVASAPHQNHQHHIHNSCTSPPRRTSHHIARARAHASTRCTHQLPPLLSSPLPPVSKGPLDFSTNFTRPRPTVTDCATRREQLFAFSLPLYSFLRFFSLRGFWTGSISFDIAREGCKRNVED